MDMNPNHPEAPMASLFFRVISLLVLALLGVPLSWAAPPESYALHPCALAQSGPHPRVYLTAPSDEVQAVDVATGKSLWHTAKASFVFLARDNRLLAAFPPAKGKPGCGLGILDARTGKVVKRLPALEGEGAGCVGEGISGSFHLEGATKDEGDCLIWTKKWWPTPGGAYRGPDYLYPAGSSGSKQGLVMVDLLKGEISPPVGFFPNTTLRTQSFPWGGYSTEPFQVGDVTAQASMELLGNRYQLVLRRWRSSESLPQVSLGNPPWNSCGVVVCGDHRNVLGVYQNQGKTDPFTYHIGVYDAATGGKMAEVDATSWPSAAQLYGNHLVCYFPNRVFVMNISTGKELWSRPVKDLTYRGPYPPSARPPEVPERPQE